MNLYHFTDYHKIFKILKSGKLMSRRETDLHDYKSFQKDKDHAIFFTRNFNLQGTALKTRCCLEIDGEELKRRYKTYPFNYFLDQDDYKSDPETVESEEIVFEKEILLDNKLVKKIYFFQSLESGHRIIDWFNHVIKDLKAKNLKQIKSYIEEKYDIEAVFLKGDNSRIPSKKKDAFKYLESFHNYFL